MLLRCGTAHRSRWRKGVRADVRPAASLVLDRARLEPRSSLLRTPPTRTCHMCAACPLPSPCSEFLAVVARGSRVCTLFAHHSNRTFYPRSTASTSLPMSVEKGARTRHVVVILIRRVHSVGGREGASFVLRVCSSDGTPPGNPAWEQWAGRGLVLSQNALPAPARS